MEDLNKIIRNKPAIHTRDITLATYDHTDSRVIVHGILKDMRHVPIFDITGEIKQPGVIHHMDVKLLIAAKPLRIELAQAQMIAVPMTECPATLDTVSQLNGLEIKAGFSGRLRKIMGGPRGCTHLCHLITVMGQEIVHGWLTHKRKKESPVPKDLDTVADKAFLIDSCRMWAKDGPKVKALQKAIETQKNQH